MGNKNASCTSCIPGLYQNEAGMPLCLPCSPGMAQHLDSSKICDDCSSGKFTNSTRQKFCFDCPTGYGNTKGSARCNPIPPGFYENENGAQVRCQEGHKCEGEATGSVACKAGSYVEKPGSVDCINCSPGYFAENEAATSCKPCPLGWMRGATDNGAQCIQCKVGETTVREGSSAW